MINLYIDAEWYLNQRIFLIGYVYENTVTQKVSLHQLYKKNISQREVLQIFDRVSGYIFIYGPDVGILEKVFRLDIKANLPCINLLKIVKLVHPHWHSYKLAEVEKKYNLKRSAKKYKANIFDIYKDWHNPTLRKLVLQYNKEDVANLVKVKQRLFKEQKFTKAELYKLRLGK